MSLCSMVCPYSPSHTTYAMPVANECPYLMCPTVRTLHHTDSVSVIYDTLGNVVITTTAQGVSIPVVILYCASYTISNSSYLVDI